LAFPALGTDALATRSVIPRTRSSAADARRPAGPLARSLARRASFSTRVPHEGTRTVCAPRLLRRQPRMGRRAGCRVAVPDIRAGCRRSEEGCRRRRDDWSGQESSSLPTQGCRQPFGLLPTMQWSPGIGLTHGGQLGAAARCEHRRSRRSCQSRATRSGHQRYLVGCRRDVLTLEQP
jgi:hypothetical protein